MENLFKKLLFIAESINFEYRNLEHYSMQHEQSSKDYYDAIKRMEEYILKEEEIVRTLDLEMIESLLEKIKIDDENDFNYELIRCYNLLVDRQNEILYEISDNEESSSSLEEIDFRGEINEIDILVDLDDYLEEFDYEAYRYLDLVLCYMYTKSIKSAYGRLITIETYSSFEENLRKRIVDDFETYKFDFLSFNRFLEKISLINEFNIEKIPTYQEPERQLNNIDLGNVYYNECLLTLRNICQMYEYYGLETEMSSEYLLNITLFDEYLNHLDKNRLLKINHFLNHLENKFKFSIPIEACFKKIKHRI